MAAGRFREALPVGRELVEAARAAADPRTEGAARISLGRNLINVSGFDEAHASLLEGLRLAELAHDDRLRLQAMVNLVVLAYRRGQHDQAVALRLLALGAAQRVGDRYLETELLVTAGAALTQLGKPAEAQPMFEQAVALRRALYGERSPRLAAAITALGNAHAMQGDLEQAKTAHRQALDLTVAALGKEHPDVGTMHGNLGNDELYDLRIDAALAELATAVAIFEHAYGKEHRNVAGSLTDLGLAQLEAGRAAEALASFERADAIWAKLAPEHPVRASALFGRYRARKATGAAADVADLETAVKISQQLPAFQRARFQLELGRALGGARGAALVADAAAGFATSTLALPQRELAVARAWQAEHPEAR
jgi:serine/threonine-protein kinase